MIKPLEEPSIFPLNLILFSVGRLFFGAIASQIKRVDSYPISDNSSSKFAIDTSNIGSARRVCDAISGLDSKTSQDCRTNLIVNLTNNQECSLSVSSIEDVICVNQSDIFPFPPIIEPFAIKQGLWAVLLRDDRLYLLVDFK
ncbi:MAG: hypothetical protein HQK64_12570 [Desulfamplus sp.]|nr:hypothetical protein [Desulfamplus sp.]MBF0243293.1 hypothetical protein [Desulfamplus sp.]